MTFRLIAFDLDGTLVDSLCDLAASANALLAQCGAAPLDELAVGRMVGDGAATLVRRAFAAAGIAQPDDALDRFLGIYNGRLLECTRPYAGVPELLSELTRRGIPLAVVTNKPLASAREILEGLRLGEYFPAESVLGGDGPLPRKPDPSALRYVAKRAGASLGDTLLVGDSSVDWRTARAAGSRICLARYGFGFQQFPIEELTLADLVIDRPYDLLSFL